ncbi:MAG TPA: hypothetical protein VFM57_14640 [Thermoleophilaceae bacterium]|nr:hypothetical protein [Thermoleophilaceae bacterium]
MNWTWDSLTTADAGTLKRVFEEGATPDIEQLLDRTYDGLNIGLLTRLTGRRFKKLFYLRDGEPFGHNIQEKRGRPVELGWYRVRPDGRALRIDYDVEQNRGLYVVLRALQDRIVLPNSGDHELVLGEAKYLGLRIAYFVLRRESG